MKLRPSWRTSSTTTCDYVSVGSSEWNEKFEKVWKRMSMKTPWSSVVLKSQMIWGWLTKEQIEEGIEWPIQASRKFLWLCSPLSINKTHSLRIHRLCCSCFILLRYLRPWCSFVRRWGILSKRRRCEDMRTASHLQFECMFFIEELVLEMFRSCATVGYHMRHKKTIICYICCFGLCAWIKYDATRTGIFHPSACALGPIAQAMINLSMIFNQNINWNINRNIIWFSLRFRIFEPEILSWQVSQADSVASWDQGKSAGAKSERNGFR